MTTNASFRRVTVYGPFKRVESKTQTAADLRAIVRSGELWGGLGRFGAAPAAKAYPGELSTGERGFEFFSVAPPDGEFGPPYWRERSDGTVRVVDGTARVKIFVSRVTMDF